MGTEEPPNYSQLKNQTLDRLDIAYAAIENKQDERDPLVLNFRGLYQDWWTIGNCSIELDSPTQARTEYAAAGLYLRELIVEAQNRWMELDKSVKYNFGVDLKWGFYITVLSGSEPLIRAVGRDILTLSDDFKQDYGSEHGSTGSYWRTCVLNCLFFRQDDQAERYLAEYPEEDDAPMTALLVPLHEAMLADDASATREALDAVVDAHEELLGESRPWKAAFSHTAAAHLLVARHRGMDISASEFGEPLPDAFDEYDIGDDLELPSPEYVDEALIPE